MTAPHPTEVTPPTLRCAHVLAVTEETCTVRAGDGEVVARFAPPFPSPRTARVSPGHLVALARAPDGANVVLWRWYDGVVLDDGAAGPVRMWEPAHGEVVATPRWTGQTFVAMSRAYLSSGLPGAAWWVEGAATTRAADARVDLAAVARLYTENAMWPSALASRADDRSRAD